MPSDIRRLAFKIENATAEDKEKLIKSGKDNKCRFLIFVIVGVTTVHGFAITDKDARGLSKWRKILSTKTKDKEGDFQQDKDCAIKTYNEQQLEAYYTELGRVIKMGIYVKQGTRVDRTKKEETMLEACEKVEAGAHAEELVLKDPSLYNRKRELEERERDVRQESAKKKSVSQICDTAPSQIEEKFNTIIAVSLPKTDKCVHIAVFIILYILTSI
jgi:hypothetical protein